jgi:solute carrier family 13 (sodium-dependent dicarboxylate transporter), member 2/3/5
MSMNKPSHSDSVSTLTLRSKQIGFLAGPLLFFILCLSVPETFISPKSPFVLGLMGWMICWWISEAAPVAVTALLPLVIFPATGTMSMAEAAAPFANTSIFLFMGGFMIALALEKHKLHERIALNLIKLTGTSGNGVILGFSLATGILSMWISNTATAMMMLPIALSVIELLKNARNSSIEMDKRERHFALGLLLCIGYMASIGGMATVIGTPPNTVFAGFAKQFYNNDMEFGKWMLIGVPVALLLGTSCYLLVVHILFPNQLNKIAGAEELIQQKLHALGKLGKAEKRVLVVFFATAMGWILQTPINRWTDAEILNDTNVAMCGGILMFLVPVSFQSSQFLLHWDDTKRLPWSILLLFGGGICLAKGMESTGVITTIGNVLVASSTIGKWTLLLTVISITVVLTELMSNVALVTIFIPVVFAVAEGFGINPILLGLPVTFAASSGYMFPISTPPNAIVFASGYIKMKEMIRAGLLLDLVSIAIIFLLSWALLEKINL